jgi:DNA-directed RNA polymerase I subunit RPA43
MSTEIMSPVSKDKADKMSKKRRREEELAQSKESSSQPAKKSKKARETAVKQESTEEPAQEATPAKKEKKKRRKSVEVQTDEAATEDAKPSFPEGILENDDAGQTNGTEESKIHVPTTTSTAIKSKHLSSKSPFIKHTTSFYLALSPIAHQFPLEGLCAEHISPLILTYYPPMKGVVLSYSDPRLSESPEVGSKITKSKDRKTVLGRSVDEYAVTYVWLTVELLVFKPQRGTVLEGYVNLQNESILGLICYNYFNAGIERSRLPKDWQWVEDEAQEDSGEMSRRGRREAAGHYVNAEGNKVEGKIVFKVKDFEATAGAETGSGSINIYGTLLVESEDKKVDEDARQKALVRERPARR